MASAQDHYLQAERHLQRAEDVANSDDRFYEAVFEQETALAEKHILLGALRAKLDEAEK